MNEELDKFVDGILAAIEAMKEAKFMTHEQRLSFLKRTELKIRDEHEKELKKTIGYFP